MLLSYSLLQLGIFIAELHEFLSVDHNLLQFQRGSDLFEDLLSFVQVFFSHVVDQVALDCIDPSTSFKRADPIALESALLFSYSFHFCGVFELLCWRLLFLAQKWSGADFLSEWLSYLLVLLGISTSVVMSGYILKFDAG